MTVERHDPPVRQPSLEELLNRTRQSFINTETYDPTLPKHPRHGKAKEGYTFLNAARTTVNALSEEGIDIFGLFGKIARETKISPADEDWARLDGLETWDEVLKSMLTIIISSEIPNKFPELVKENYRRATFMLDEDY